jgi:hypothetical protein
MTWPGRGTNRDTFTATDLKARGWTNGLINRFLGEPDATRRSPFYRRGSPIKLYEASRVQEVETSPQFAEAIRKATVKSKAASQAAQRRADSLLAVVKAIEITVRRIDLQTLRREAIKEWEANKLEGGRFDADGQEADEATVRRWMVNYARHRLTVYDAIIEGLYAKVGKQQAYKLLKARTLQAIATAYPELANECRAQAERAHSMLATGLAKGSHTGVAAG